MNVDELLYRLPLIGGMVRRLYRYFKRNTAVTDFFHVLVGFGAGLVIAGESWLVWGLLAIIIGLAFHIFALVRG